MSRKKESKKQNKVREEYCLKKDLHIDLKYLSPNATGIKIDKYRNLEISSHTYTHTFTDNCLFRSNIPRIKLVCGLS